jgi:hypothetical protein
MQQQHRTATKVEVEEALIDEIGSFAVSKKRNTLLSKGIRGSWHHGLQKEQTVCSTIAGSASDWLIRHNTDWDLRMYSSQVMRHISRHFGIATDLISQTGFW